MTKSPTGSATRLRGLCLMMALLCAAPAVPPAYAQQLASNEATLNFVGAEIESVIKAIGHYTNRTFIIDPRVKGTINLVSEKPVTKQEAFHLLTSSLRLQGYAVVSGDGFTKVVPEADAKLQAGPIQRGTIRGDQIATQIFHLDHETAANLVPVLRPLITPNNTINANPGSNTLVITDYADNLRRLSRIIASLDSPAGSDLDVVPIKHAMATDIASMVTRLMGPGGGNAPGQGAAGNRITLLADSRTNAVLMRAPSAAQANLARSLIQKLDQPTAMPGNVHVVYLKNAQATKLAETLRAVVSSDSSSSANSTSGSTNQPSQNTSGLNDNQNSAQTQPLAPSQAEGPLPTGGPAGFIQADPSTNSLIITASEPVYRNLRAVIDQLDARRAQVYIESLIVEVTSDKAAELGVQWAGLSGDSSSRYRVGALSGFSSGGNNLVNLAAGAAGLTEPVLPGNGLNLGIFRQIGGSLGLGAVARALESDGNANILSMPNLITLDNEEARIIVGQNVPFVTGQFTTQASGGGAGVNPFQTIEREDVGLSLRVRPQISEGGTVKLAIYQETSNIAPTSGAADIITNKRSIETNVLVDDGQIIVLGGLIEDTANDTMEKVPGLGDIPVVGNLFKYQTRKRTKTNLMVFLRPTVIRGNEQSVNIAADRYNYIRNVEILAQPASSLVMPNTGSPMLPPMENGQMVGGPLLNLQNQANGGVVPASQQRPPGSTGPNLPAFPVAQPGLPTTSTAVGAEPAL